MGASRTILKKIGQLTICLHSKSHNVSVFQDESCLGMDLDTFSVGVCGLFKMYYTWVFVVPLVSVNFPT